ncbi:hypothetical protein C8Q79DRAFT_1015179 [Trametes meyenii]|nr:hypothetical protein C8Q79DRAFT_1015179 [Trametes meyenii]
MSRKEMKQGPRNLRMYVMCTQDNAGRNFLFPQLERNPLLPQRLREPGLLYRVNDEWGWQSGVQTLFVGLRPAKFRYYGEYELVRAQPLSPAEFRSWASPVKTRWGKAIGHMVKFKEIRVRVILHWRRGHEPTQQEVQSLMDEDDKHEVLEGRPNDKKQKAHLVEAIVEAYERGDETMACWAMTCVGFDLELLRQIRKFQASLSS